MYERDNPITNDTMQKEAQQATHCRKKLNKQHNAERSSTNKIDHKEAQSFVLVLHNCSKKLLLITKGNIQVIVNFRAIIAKALGLHLCTYAIFAQNNEGTGCSQRECTVISVGTEILHNI